MRRLGCSLSLQGAWVILPDRGLLLWWWRLREVHLRYGLRFVWSLRPFCERTPDGDAEPYGYVAAVAGASQGAERVGSDCDDRLGRCGDGAVDLVCRS